MRATEFIVEYRNRLLQYVKSLLPTWPEYVLKDWLVPNKGNFSNLPPDALKNSVMEKVKGAGLTPNSKWQLVPDMKFTMDMFDPMTKQRLVGRAGGTSDLGMGIPRDKERHATQAALAQQQGGVRSEPVLLIKSANGYELLEGWHRTIQHFHKFPDGYTGPAYVAVAQSKQGVAEGFNGGDIELSHSMSPDILYVHVTSDGSDVGGARFKKIDGVWTGDIVHVYPQFRRQGVATKIYDYAEELVGKINPSKTLKPKGKKFWSSRDTQGVAEGFSNDMSTEDMIAYLRQHHDTNLHQDYLNHLNTFSKFVLKDIPTNTLKTDLPGLDREKVEQYKKMDQSKAPPIVLGGKYILDGYHRANAVKEMGIPTIKAYVGISAK